MTKLKLIKYKYYRMRNTDDREDVVFRYIGKKRFIAYKNYYDGFYCYDNIYIFDDYQKSLLYPIDNRVEKIKTNE